MTVDWSIDCTFLFQEWNTRDNAPLFVLGLLGSVLFSALAMLAAPLRSSLQHRVRHLKAGREGRLLLTLVETGLNVVRFGLMFLIMTMNGWVNLAILLGVGFGYFLTQRLR